MKKQLTSQVTVRRGLGDPRRAEGHDRITIVLTPELDLWFKGECKRMMQGKSATARFYLAEAYQRAQVGSGAA